MGNATIEERVAVLEAGHNQLHEKLIDVSNKVDDIHELSAAIKVIASETKNISEKVDKIDDRLSNVEKQPTKDFNYYKRTIIGGVISTLVSTVIAALIVLVGK